MLYFSRAKIAGIVFVCLFSLYLALPSMIPTSLQKGFVEKAMKFLPSGRVNLGLDLRGGSQLMLEVNFDHYLSEQVNNLKNEIKSSFHNDGIVALPELQEKKIVININDSTQQKEIERLVRKISRDVDIDEKNGSLLVYFSDEKISQLRKNLIGQSIEIIRRRIDETGTKEPIIQAQGINRILLQVPGVKDSAELKRILGKTAKLTFHLVDERTFVGGSFSVVESDVERVSDQEGRGYILKKEALLSGEMLVDASPTYFEGLPAVAFRFNDAGAKKFSKITRENLRQFFAVVLDGKVVTAPRINTPIDQGSGVISGNFTVEEANQVALLLRAGALPAPLEVVEERTVGPSLGSDSIKSGAISIIFALVLVAAFMVFFYGLFGMIANLALVVNVVMILAVLALMGATLTLPGMAGIVLTMGMAVDANVLIFERIKEELRNGSKIVTAVEQGFSQAYRTITDSNLTSLAVAFALYVFGNGSVKGFAVTLTIGIIASMFSAIVLTRLIISVWLKKSRPKKLSLI